MGEAETIVRYPDLVDAMVAAGRDATSGRARLDELKALIASDGWQPEVQTELDELRTIASPTLLVWGRSDPLGDPAAANLVADVIPNSKLELLDAGHGPWLGHPDAVANLVQRFVTGD